MAFRRVPLMLNAAVAKAELQRLRKELVPMGLLTNVDRSALAAFCVGYAGWVKAGEQIAQLGEYIKSSKSGYLIPAPWVGVANKALELMHKYATEFGSHVFMVVNNHRRHSSGDTYSTSHANGSRVVNVAPGFLGSMTRPVASCCCRTMRAGNEVEGLKARREAEFQLWLS